MEGQGKANRRRKRKQPEAELQRALCKLLDHAAAPGVVWFAVPNGGARSPTEAAIMAGLGVKPGILDLAFIIPPNGSAALLELKAKPKRIKPGSEQDKVRAAIIRAGGRAAEANTIEEAVAILTSWQAMRRIQL